MEINKILPDKKKANEGIVVEYVQGDNKIQVTLALAGSKNFQKILNRKMRAWVAKNPGQQIEDEASEDLTREVIAEAVILNITGITDKGAPVFYTSELGKQILETNLGFRNFVNANSLNIENFSADKEVEASASNLKSVPQLAD